MRLVFECYASRDAGGEIVVRDPRVVQEATPPEAEILDDKQLAGVLVGFAKLLMEKR